jgi:glutathione S-transferase
LIRQRRILHRKFVMLARPERFQGQNVFKRHGVAPQSGGFSTKYETKTGMPLPIAPTLLVGRTPYFTRRKRCSISLAYKTKLGRKTAMKLYMHPVSMTSRPVRLFIAENKIPVDEVTVDLFTGEQYGESYTAINPNNLVPMIEDGDLRLTESSAILKYLADKIGSPAYPKDLNFYRDWAYNLAYPQLFPHLKRRSDEAQAATIEIGQQNARRWLKVLNDHWIGPKNQYLVGNQITIADYFGAGLVTLGEVIRCDFSAYPNVQRWLNNMKTLPNWGPVNEVFHGLVASVKEQQFHAI